MGWVDDGGQAVSDPLLLQSLGSPPPTASPTLAPDADSARGGKWLDDSGQPVTDPLILKSLGAPSTARGMGGDRPDSYDRPKMTMASDAARNLLSSDTPFGYGEPGSGTDMANAAFRGLRTAGHSAITGAVKAGGGVLDMLGAAASGSGATPYGMPDDPKDMPSSLATAPFFSHVMPEYKPTTLPGRMFQAATGGALLAAPYGAAASLLGGLSGGGAEAGGEAGGLLGDRLGPYGRDLGTVAGSLLAGGLPSLIHGRSTSAENIANSRFGHLPDSAWDQGIARQDQARTLGMPLLATEALDVPAGHSMTADLAQTPEGAQIGRALTVERPDEVRQGVNQQVLDPISAQPVSTGQTAAKVQGAAEDAIQQAERDRTVQTSPFYRSAAADNVPQSQAQAIVSQIDGAIANDPGNLNPQLRAMRAALVNPDGSLVTNVGALDRVRQIFRDRVELPPTSASAIERTAARELPLGDLRDTLTRASPDFAQGRALHEQISQDTVAPLQRSDIGTLADRAGIPENRGIQSQINTIANPATARPEQISQIATQLNMADPTAFPELARTYFENAFDAASKGPRGAPDAPQGGIAFRQAVNGTPQQQANNRAILEGVAQAHGIPSGGLVAGFDNAMQVLDRMGLIPGSGSPTHQRGALAAEAGSGVGTYLSNLVIDKPSTIINFNPQAWYRSRAYSTLAGAITSPDGAQQLRRLSMYNPGSRQAQAIVGQLAGITAAEPPPSQGN